VKILAVNNQLFNTFNNAVFLDVSIFEFCIYECKTDDHYNHDKSDASHATSCSAVYVLLAGRNMVEQNCVAGDSSPLSHTPHDFSSSVPVNSDGCKQSFVDCLATTKTASQWSLEMTVCIAN